MPLPTVLATSVPVERAERSSRPPPSAIARAGRRARVADAGGDRVRGVVEAVDVVEGERQRDDAQQG